MNRMVLAGIIVVVALSGCGSDPAESTTPSTAATPSTATPATPAPPTTAPATPAPAATAPESLPPEVPAAVPSEVPSEAPPAAASAPEDAVGESPNADLYLETCEQFVTAIDGIAATGAVTREQAATGVGERLQSNPNWSTIPAEDQQEMLRGLDAAGRGTC